MITDDADLSALLALLLTYQTPVQATALVAAVAVTTSASYRATQGLAEEVCDIQTRLDLHRRELSKMRSEIGTALKAQQGALTEIRQTMQQLQTH